MGLTSSLLQGCYFGPMKWGQEDSANNSAGSIASSTGDGGEVELADPMPTISDPATPPVVVKPPVVVDDPDKFLAFKNLTIPKGQDCYLQIASLNPLARQIKSSSESVLELSKFSSLQIYMYDVESSAVPDPLKNASMILLFDSSAKIWTNTKAVLPSELNASQWYLSPYFMIRNSSSVNDVNARIPESLRLHGCQAPLTKLPTEVGGSITVLESKPRPWDNQEITIAKAQRATENGPLIDKDCWFRSEKKDAEGNFVRPSLYEIGRNNVSDNVGNENKENDDFRISFPIQVMHMDANNTKPLQNSGAAAIFAYDDANMIWEDGISGASDINIEETYLDRYFIIRNGTEYSVTWNLNSNFTFYGCTDLNPTEIPWHNEAIKAGF